MSKFTLSCYFLFLFFITKVANGQTIITGQTYFKNTAIQFYLPIDEVANRFIATVVHSDSLGNFRINFHHKVTNSVQISIGNIPVTVFVSPGDSINIKNNGPSHLDFEGDNSIGNDYFNKIYNIPLGKKFENLRNEFDSKEFSLEKVINQNSYWLDSLYTLEKISYDFLKVAKTDIESVLLWEYFNLLGNGLDLTANRKIEIEAYFKKLNFSELTRTDNGVMFYSWTYLPFIFSQGKVKNTGSNTSLLQDLPYLIVSPDTLKKHFIGEAIIIYCEMEPLMYDYKSILEKYISLYGENAYSNYIKQIIYSYNQAKNENTNVINVKTHCSDFFTLIGTNFPNQRLYVDLWATWCGPCLLEFSITPKDFKTKLSELNIKQIYISIDEDNYEKWQKTTVSLNLEGYNFYVNELMIQSIKEIVYNNSNTSIPRYIIVDENGKLLDTDAPRPSDPNLINYLKTLFK